MKNWVDWQLEFLSNTGKNIPAILNAIAFMGMKLRCDGFIAAWGKLDVASAINLLIITIVNPAMMA